MIEAGDMPKKGTAEYELSILAKETSDRVKFSKKLLDVFDLYANQKYVRIEVFKQAMGDFFWNHLDSSISSKAFKEMDRLLVLWKLTDLSSEEKLATVRDAFEKSNLYKWFQANVLKVIIKTNAKTKNSIPDSNINNFEHVFVDHFVKAYISKRKQQK